MPQNAQMRQGNSITGSGQYIVMGQNGPQRIDHATLSRMHLESVTHQQIIDRHGQAAFEGQNSRIVNSNVAPPSAVSQQPYGRLPVQLPATPQAPSRGPATATFSQPPITPMNNDAQPVKPVTPASADKSLDTTRRHPQTLCSQLTGSWYHCILVGLGPFG